MKKPVDRKIESKDGTQYRIDGGYVDYGPKPDSTPMIHGGTRIRVLPSIKGKAAKKAAKRARHANQINERRALARKVQMVMQFCGVDATMQEAVHEAKATIKRR